MAVNKSSKPTKKSKKTNPLDKRGMHPNSLAALAKHGLKAGPDPRRNMHGPVPKDMMEARARIKHMFSLMMHTETNKEGITLFDQMILDMIQSKQSASVIAMLKAAYPGLLSDDLNIQQTTKLEQVIQLYIPDNGRNVIPAALTETITEDIIRKAKQDNDKHKLGEENGS